MNLRTSVRAMRVVGTSFLQQRGDGNMIGCVVACKAIPRTRQRLR